MAPSSTRSGFTRRSRWVRAVTQRSPLRTRPREKAGRQSISRSPRACREARHGSSSSLMQNLLSLAATLRVGGAMIYPLLALAVVAETYGFDWDDLEREVNSLGPRNYFGRFFRIIIENQKRPVWWVESRAAEEASLIERSLGRWLWILETTVTAAPLLGLLGTITGMIRAFRLFGTEGLVDPRGVTGGVAEALIATAVGLFIALVALFAYNYFSHRQAQIMDELEQLGTRLIDHLRLNGAEPGP